MRLTIWLIAALPAICVTAGVVVGFLYSAARSLLRALTTSSSSKDLKAS
jgi:hypothetical protein